MRSDSRLAFHHVALVALVAGLIALSLGAVARSAPAAKGARPDPTFGAGKGWVTTPFPGLTANAYAATVIGGGDIVAAGQAINNTGNGQIVVVRYRPNGSLDTGFGTGGIFKTTLPTANGPYVGRAVVQLPTTGKLLVAGGTAGSMMVLRLTPAGRLDRTFGARGTGIATVSTGGFGGSIALQRNGGILVGSSNGNSAGQPLVVARLTPAGQLDRSFGRAGIAQALFWNPVQAESSGVDGLAVTPDGGAVAAGHLDYIGGNGHGSAAVFRLSASGRLVSSFGTQGHVEITPKPIGPGRRGQWFPAALTLSSSGAITVTGDGTIGTGKAFVSARLTATGKPDRSFGTAGNGVVVTLGASSAGQTLSGATSSPPGGLTVGTGSTVAQLTPNGAPNQSFAPRGVLAIGTPRQVTVYAVTSSGSGALVIAGSAGNALYVARYLLA
jgi:uncharacterized delta-60 repeat protein